MIISDSPWLSIMEQKAAWLGRFNRLVTPVHPSVVSPHLAEAELLNLTTTLNELRKFSLELLSMQRTADECAIEVQKRIYATIKAYTKPTQLKPTQLKPRASSIESAKQIQLGEMLANLSSEQREAYWAAVDSRRVKETKK
jgi:hypothetical protein